MLMPRASAQESLDVEVPTCAVVDAREGEAAMAAGLARLRQGQAIEPNPDSSPQRDPRALALYEQALGDFDRACALSGPMALERRSTTLSLLGRFYEAQRNLDAFLAQVPEETLDAAVLQRVQLNTARLRRFLVHVRVQVTPADAQVRLDGVPLSTMEAHLLPARAEAYTLEITREGYAPTRRTLEALRGRSHELEVALLPAASSGEGRADYVPAIAVVGGVSALLLGSAIGLQLVADARAQTFNTLCSERPGPESTCSALRSDYDLFFNLSIASYVGSAVALVSTGVLLGLELSTPSHSAPTVACVPMLGIEGAGATCAGTF